VKPKRRYHLGKLTGYVQRRIGAGERVIRVPANVTQGVSQDEIRYVVKMAQRSRCGIVIQGIGHWDFRSPETKGGCYLTTACIDAAGLADDCDELVTLRAFRDGYLSGRLDGERLVREYYDVAPRIVEAIDGSESRAAVYADIYERLVVKSVDLIRRGRNAEALTTYRRFVRELSARYLQGPRSRTDRARDF
jgi:hypothetical protein